MRRQQGVASLVVVMLLFMIVAMVAAYTNRNLIFEQRTSVNQYRSTQALEAAEAGLEWAKAMLNYGRISNTCTTSTTLTDTTFRERYLSIGATGLVTEIADSTPPGGQLTPSCVRASGGWSCSCPVTGAPSLSVTGSDISPAFRVRFVSESGQPGLVRVEVNGCTRLEPSCLNFAGLGLGSEGRATLTELVGLASALPSPPLAALTAGGSVNATAGMTMALYNDNRASGGLTIQARDSVDTTGLALVSLPGTPGDASVLPGDGSLPATANRMFTGVFNMWPNTYRDQPGALVLDALTPGCSLSGSVTNCSASAVRTASSLNPGRPLWIAGNLAVNSAGNIGSATQPVMLIVNGDLTFTPAAATSTLFGAVYVRTATWNTSGAGQIQGALVAQGAVDGNASTAVTYDAAVLKLLRLTTGSWVAVPGGWKDYCTGAPSTSWCR